MGGGVYGQLDRQEGERNRFLVVVFESEQQDNGAGLTMPLQSE